MTKLSEYTVRPFSKPPRKDLNDTFYIYLSSTALSSQKLQAGDVCVIWKDESSRGKAIAWPAREKIHDNVVQTSRPLQSICKLSLGDKIVISKDESPTAVIDTVYLEEVPPPDQDKVMGVGDSRGEYSHWEWFLGDPLERAEWLAIGMVFEDVLFKRRRRTFRVKDIDDQDGRRQILAKFNETSRVKIVATDAIDDGVNKPFELSTDDNAGLAPQIQRINKVLRNFDPSTSCMPAFLDRPGGLLLYGPAGTGKRMLLERIAQTGWGTVFRIDTTDMSQKRSEAASNLRHIFDEAKSYPRSIIIIDELDLMASKTGRQDGGLSYIGTLRSEFRALKKSKTSAQVLVAAATSCMDEIDGSLRGSHAFEFQIEIPIPKANARVEILKDITGVPLSEADTMLEKLGERTHGYTRNDLYDLMQCAGRECYDRLIRLDSKARRYNHVNGDTDANEVARGITDKGRHLLTQEDIDEALLQIRPTAMREISLEVPKVRWSDIGGQEHVKQSLKETIEWPLTEAAEMERLGLQPKKGLLLYGPPGCSKTMIARALATESDLNFIAVKGADFIDKYVGESEKRLREIFSKARAASPSIIFFDEVDSIASRREGGQNTGLNVLTTMLNEMDGIEPLRGVTVLAATNKPKDLDPALIRPGRLDTILYVGLPDLDARREILRITLARMDVAEDVNIHNLAQEMDGYTGAEIVSICTNAGHRALQNSKDTGKKEQISRSHFDYALSVVDRAITPGMIRDLEQWRVAGIDKI